MPSPMKMNRTFGFSPGSGCGGEDVVVPLPLEEAGDGGERDLLLGQARARGGPRHAGGEDSGTRSTSIPL